MPESASARLQDYLSHPLLKNIRGANVDWAAEGSEPPNTVSRLNAVRVLQVAGDLQIEPSYVAVSADGGIGICFKRGKWYGDIECFNSGEIWAIISDRLSPAQTWQLDDTVARISQSLERIDLNLKLNA